MLRREFIIPLGGAAAAVLLLLAWVGLSSIDFSELRPWAETRNEVTARADADTKRKVDEAEQLRLATLEAEQGRKAKAEAEAEAKRNAEDAQQQRRAPFNAEDHKRSEAEARVRYSTLVSQSNADINAGNYDRAIATLSEAMRLDPNDHGLAPFKRGIAYGIKGDYQRAISDFSEVIRLDPKSVLAFRNRGLAYDKKGDYDRAIADFIEAIRLNPNDALSFCRRGRAKLKINEQGGDADIARARQLDAAVCR